MIRILLFVFLSIILIFSSLSTALADVYYEKLREKAEKIESVYLCDNGLTSVKTYYGVYSEEVYFLTIIPVKSGHTFYVRSYNSVMSLYTFPFETVFSIEKPGSIHAKAYSYAIWIKRLRGASANAAGLMERVSNDCIKQNLN